MLLATSISCSSMRQQLPSCVRYDLAALSACARFCRLVVSDATARVLVAAARCLDQYFELRVRQVEQKEAVEMDPRLVAVVERMLDRCGMRWHEYAGIWRCSCS
jgi:hypothetical protein